MFTTDIKELDRWTDGHPWMDSDFETVQEFILYGIFEFDLSPL